MRIIGGLLKGRKIKSVKGTLTRPTSDFVREALFNILGDKVIESYFLDLFAGTGAVGLEAISRGAAKAVFVEKNPAAYSVIKQNIKNLELGNKAHVIKGDVILALKKLEYKKQFFDIIFMDPPYLQDQIEPVLNFLQNSSIVKSLVIVQHLKHKSFEYSGFEYLKQKIYGKTALTFLKKE